MLDARPVQVRAGLPAQVEDVLEALVRHERRPRAAPLEQRVRRDRRPVREALDVLGADGGGGRDDRLLLPCARRDLRDPDLAVRDEHRVGERSADVDPERAHRRILDHEPSRSRATCTASSASGSAIAPLPSSCASASARSGSARSAARRSLEHAVLQTCYRVELYAHLTSGVEDARDELVDALSTAHGVPRELLLDHLYVHAGEDVARHLCRVAAGLDSLVLGEAEILGQVGDAFGRRASAGNGRAGASTLLFRTAISAGRRARSETAIGANPATASSMALALAEGALGELSRRARARRRSRAASGCRR